MSKSSTGKDRKVGGGASLLSNELKVKSSIRQTEGEMFDSIFSNWRELLLSCWCLCVCVCC